MTPRLMEQSETAPPGFVRVPGVFRRAELEPVDKLEPGFHVVPAGSAPDGTELVAVFQRQRTAKPAAPDEIGPVSVEITLPDDAGHLVVRYCDVCHRWGGRRSVHLCGVNWHPRLEGLLKEIATEAREGRSGR
jgi:hypothetical protein